MFTKVTHLGEIGNYCYFLHQCVRQYARVLTIKAPKNNFEIIEVSKSLCFYDVQPPRVFDCDMPDITFRGVHK